MVNRICQTHPLESKAEFKRPIQWTSSVTPSQISGGKLAGLFNVQLANSKYDDFLMFEIFVSLYIFDRTPKSTATSIATRSDGQPLFHLEQIGNSETTTAKVSSMEYFGKILEIAEDSKLKEIQQVIQANRSPMENISGSSGDSAKILSDAFDAVENEKETKRKEQAIKLYKLLLALNALDLQTMQTSVVTSKKEKVLDIKKVSDEVQMLQAFCGKDSRYALVSIDFESTYTYANGYRSPPWRQIYGELCYLEIVCHDKDKFVATATKNGFFVNKGYSLDERGNVFSICSMKHCLQYYRHRKAKLRKSLGCVPHSDRSAAS